MPAVTRVSANSASGTITGPGASTVYCEGQKVSLINDKVAPHGKPPHASASIVGASSTVFANGKPVVRAGDPASCGHNTDGASSTFAG
jgi:uncharacterized Zn-binding protein involved in type VI secretion